MININPYDIIKKSNLFDEKWYKSQYLKNKSINPIKHFLDTGCKNYCNPSPIFDIKWYLDSYSDVTMDTINPFIHYIMYGRKEGRLPNPNFDLKSLNSYDSILYSGLFDEEWFSSYYSLEESSVDLIRYYLDHYLYYGLNPSKEFDSIGYLENNPDVKRKGVNPFVHYVKHGRKEGRQPI